jgi:WD40 repeat protein
VVVAPDGSWLASTGRDATVRIWDPHSGQLRYTLADGARQETVLAVSPDGSWLASAGRDSIIRIWDPRRGKRRYALTGHTSWVNALAVAHDGSWLASVSHDATVRIWDPQVGRCLMSLRTGGPLHRVTLSGTVLIAAGVAPTPYYLTVEES